MVHAEVRIRRADPGMQMSRLRGIDIRSPSVDHVLGGTGTYECDLWVVKFQAELGESP